MAYDPELGLLKPGFWDRVKDFFSRVKSFLFPKKKKKLVKKLVRNKDLPDFIFAGAYVPELRDGPTELPKSFFEQHEREKKRAPKYGRLFR